MKKLAFIIFFVQCVGVLSYGQCYELIGDFGGLAQDPKAVLGDVSCELKDAFPAEFRSNVKVYDFGFYIFNEQMGIDQFESKARAQISLPYYILFLRKTTAAGIYSDLSVEFEFPVGIGKFNCLIEDDITNFRLYLSAYLKQSYNSSKSANLAIYATIKEYIKFVKEKSECCVQGVMAGSCESCLSAEQASAVLDAANFTSHSVFKINAVQINAGDLFGGNFKQNAKFTVVTDKGEFNSEELISNFITEGQKYITPIKAASYYVNEKDCEDIIQNEISNNDNSYFAKALVFLIKGKEKEKSYVKVKVIYNKGKGPTKSLRIVKTQPSSLDNGKLEGAIKTFLGYCGVNIPICIDVPASVDAASPNDIYIWIGKSRDKICPLVGLFADMNNLKLTSNIEDWCNSNGVSSPESSTLFWDGIIQPSGVVDESTLNYWQNILKGDISKVAAFFILHSIGHASGCNHVEPEDPCEAGFMRSGYRLIASRADSMRAKDIKQNVHYWITTKTNKEYSKSEYDKFRWNEIDNYILGSNFVDDRFYYLEHLNTDGIRKKIKTYLE